jgi:lactate dehydrogenase-like 2-hydroxyacid dehydrogenase
MVGNIAKHGFGMNVIYFDQYSKHTDSNFTPVNSLEELFLKSDIVSIHVSLSEETKCIIDKKYLNLKKNLILINTARGGIVNTVDCLEALQNGNLSGIGFDVVRNDDSYKNFPIQDNIVFTQHTAFMTKEAIAEIMRQTFGNIYGLKPENRVV